MTRVNKWLALRGWCSRREADEFVRRGLVKVDGVVAKVGAKVLEGQRVEVSEQVRALQQKQTWTFLLNKPVGVLSGQPRRFNQVPAVRLLADPSRCSRNGDLLRGVNRADYMRGLAPCGRLDANSQGLLVLSSDGRVARELIGPDTEVDKEYVVGFEGSLRPDSLRLLNHGLELDGQELRPANVVQAKSNLLRFVLRQGRHRQIRRMCAQVGLEVTYLKRIRIGKIVLDFPPGTWRPLRPDESFT